MNATQSSNVATSLPSTTVEMGSSERNAKIGSLFEWNDKALETITMLAKMSNLSSSEQQVIASVIKSVVASRTIDCDSENNNGSSNSGSGGEGDMMLVGKKEVSINNNNAVADDNHDESSRMILSGDDSKGDVRGMVMNQVRFGDLRIAVTEEPALGESYGKQQLVQGESCWEADVNCQSFNCGDRVEEEDAEENEDCAQDLSMARYKVHANNTFYKLYLYPYELE